MPAASVTAAAGPLESPLQYRGGKRKLSKWIAPQLPSREVYVEPCGGMASVLLRRRPSPTEILNDLDGLVVTWWRVLRDDCDALADRLALTPFSEAEFEQACQVCLAPGDHDDLTVAAAVAVTLRQGLLRSLETQALTNPAWHNPPVSSLPQARSCARTWGRLPDGLATVAQRMRHVVLTCRDAVDLVDRWAGCPDAVIYLDPPYLGTAEFSSQFDHQAVLDRLAGKSSPVAAAVAISGYPTCPWDELGWRCEVRDWGRRGMGAGAKQECLYMNYPPVNGQQDVMPLWADTAASRQGLVPVG